MRTCEDGRVCTVQGISIQEETFVREICHYHMHLTGKYVYSGVHA
jgi:hypothetical protein